MQLDAETWNRFVLDNHGSFLQSWQWGEFQERVGRRVFRFAEDDWAIQFIEMSLPFGKAYWYGPRGPVIKFPISNYRSPTRPPEADSGFTRQNLPILSEFPNNFQFPISNFQTLKTPNNIVFLRLDPAWPPEHKNIFSANGWRQTKDVQPRRNWVLDIAKPDEELLAAMQPKTRYNIKLALKQSGVRPRTKPQEDFEYFWELVTAMAMRHDIRAHPKEYYEKMLAMPIAELWQAEYRGQTIASHIVVFFGTRATYLHGASSYEHRALMAPHLLHWEVIKEARNRGLAEYDFGGVDEVRWPGLTRFKKGFGGREESYVGTFDSPLRPLWYKLYQMARFGKR